MVAMLSKVPAQKYRSNVFFCFILACKIVSESVLTTLPSVCCFCIHVFPVSQIENTMFFFAPGLVGTVLLGSFQACAIYIPAAPDVHGNRASPSHCSLGAGWEVK